MSVVSHAIRRITEELSAEECRRVSYLCGDLDTQSSSSDPRATLQETLLCRDTTGTGFLKELLLKIKRYDLLKEVLSTNRSLVEKMLEHGHAVPEYRVLMADVSEDMNTEDLKSLTFLLKDTLPKQKLENAQSFLDVVVELEKLDQLSGEKMGLMERCLRSIHRADLARKITCFQQRGHASPDRLKLRAPGSISLSGVSHSSCQTRQIHKLCEKTTVKREVHGSGSGSCCQEGVYCLPVEPRGVCVIIDCVGTEADDLEQTFTSLRFDVTVHKLLSVQDVLSALSAAAHRLRQHRAGALVCCIISRSRSTRLLATDAHGRGLSLDSARSLFSSASCLTGRPKLFFIQSYETCSCTGEDDGELETDGPVSSCGARTVPVDADVFWSHFWTAERELEKADHRSVYLSALRAGLSGQRRTHVVDLHTAVNHAVYEHNRKFPDSSYSFDLRHTLRKKVYLS